MIKFVIGAITGSFLTLFIEVIILLYFEDNEKKVKK